MEASGTSRKGLVGLEPGYGDGDLDGLQGKHLVEALDVDPVFRESGAADGEMNCFWTNRVPDLQVTHQLLRQLRRGLGLNSETPSRRAGCENVAGEANDFSPSAVTTERHHGLVVDRLPCDEVEIDTIGP